jgi:maleylacetoacetate isomerase
MAADRILYGYWRSSAAYRVRLALAIKKLAYTSKAIDLRSGAQSGIGYTMLNPQGLVPYLIDSGPDGDVGLNQSLAIIEYLDETYPDPPLLPGTAIERARIRAAALTIACDIHPLNNLRVLNYLKDPLGTDQDAVDRWSEHWITSGFAAIEETAANSRGRYLFGDVVTLADVCLVPQMFNARRVHADLTAMPSLVAIDKRLNALPAFRRAAPFVQPDAPAR